MELLTGPETDTTEQFPAHGFQWTARCVVADTLRRADQWERTTLRTLPHRLVERVEGPEGPLVVKTFRPASLWQYLFARISGPPALWESAALAHALSLGLPVPRPLACGLGPDGRSALVTSYVEGVPLKEAWESGARPDPSVLAEDLAALVRTLHDRSVLHTDLHPGNVLVTAEGFALLDGRALRFPRSLPLTARLDNLAVLDLYFRLRASRHARFRFLRAYGGRDLFPGRAALRRAAALVEGRARARARRAWRKAARRLPRDGRRFQKVLEPAFRGVLRAEGFEAWNEQDLADLFHRAGEVLKDSRGALSTLRPEPGGEGGIFVKTTRPRTAWEAVRGLFRLPRSFRTFRKAYGLEVRALPAAPPRLALWRTGLSTESVYGAEAVRDGEALDRAWRHRPEGRRDLAVRLGALVADLHDRDASHRDLKAGNLLVRPDATVVVVDSDGALPGRRLTPARRVKDLARLVRTLREDCGAADSDVARLVTAYAQRGGAPAARAAAALHWGASP